MSFSSASKAAGSRWLNQVQLQVQAEKTDKHREGTARCGEGAQSRPPPGHRARAGQGQRSNGQVGGRCSSRCHSPLSRQSRRSRQAGRHLPAQKGGGPVPARRPVGEGCFGSRPPVLAAGDGPGFHRTRAGPSPQQADRSAARSEAGATLVQLGLSCLPAASCLESELEVQLKCSCGFSSTDPAAVEAHLADCEPDRFACSKCGAAGRYYGDGGMDLAVVGLSPS